MSDINNNEFQDDIENKEKEIKDIEERKYENEKTDVETNKKDGFESEKDGLEKVQEEQEAFSQAGQEGNEAVDSLGTSVSRDDEITASAESAESEKVNEAPKYSTSYDPPYYVPNFTVTRTSSGTQPANTPSQPKPKARKKRGWLIPVIAVAVLVALVLIGILGIALGYVVHNVLKFDREDTLDSGITESETEFLGDETVTIIKNDGSIDVDEQLGSTGKSGLSVVEITSLVADSVVEINTSLTVNSVFYGQYVTGGAGSGVIIGSVQNSNAYYIITNHHVIEGADTITVRLRNGDSYTATLIGSSELDDIALLRIVENSGKKLTVANLGKSSNLKVGEEVVAIGNPLGTLGGTVTDGIISALDREIMVESNVMMLLQTNAAINPGNSGGGLFNSAGELIGIVNAKQSDTGIEGLGFAIPIDRASKCVNDILEYGYVKGHPSLGVKVQTVSVSSGFSSANYVQVTKAVAGSELRVGDVICSVNGTTVSSLATFNASVYQLKVGEEVTVQVLEKNSIGQTVAVNKTVKVTEYNPKNFS